MGAQIHASAVIDEGAVVGDGCRVWHFVHVSADAHIGERSVLGQNVFIGRGVRVGRGAKIQNNVAVYEGVEVGDDVFLGPSCVFTNVLNPRAFLERKSEFRATHVGRGATVGANATIVCGHDLGEFCMIGAGAVVPRGAPAHALVVGNPARRIGWVCECGVTLGKGDGERSCSACGLRYRVSAERCERLT